MKVRISGLIAIVLLSFASERFNMFELHVIVSYLHKFVLRCSQDFSDQVFDGRAHR